MIRTQTSLGELISVCYEEFLAMYGDEELASIATAQVINDLLNAPKSFTPNGPTTIIAEG